MAVVLLGGEAGLRRGEIIALEWSDLDLKRKMLTVRQSEWKGRVTGPKGGRIRKVPLSERLVEVLTSNRHLRGERVLYRNDGQTLSPKVLRMWMSSAQKRAGLRVTGKLHILRHSFCSHLAISGVPAISIKELAGHQNLTTTMRYLHLSPLEKDRAIRLLDESRKAGFGDTSGDTNSAVAK